MKHVLTLFTASLIAVGLACSALDAAGQRTSPQDRQQALRDMNAQWNALASQMDAILQREAAREQAGDCNGNDARTTFDENVCLKDAIQKTTNNYKEYVDTLRALLRLLSPQSASDRIDGPTGAPPLADDMANEFDRVERAWDTYRAALCEAVFQAHQGGTIAPSMGNRCELEVIRAHMRELNATLRPELH